MSNAETPTGKTNIQPGTYIDEDGWTQKLPISDAECILRCLKNRPTGIENDQVAYLIKSIENGEVVHMNTYDQSGRTSKKIVIEYDVGTYERTKSND